MKYKVWAVVILLAGVALGFFVYTTQVNESQFKFRLGLDIAGGTLLTYRADISEVPEGEVDDAVRTLRDVIERRVNVFGVSEPVVQTETVSLSEGDEHRLIVELPGITDVDEAIRELGETPLLEFKIETYEEGSEEPEYISTGLTGRFLSNATLQFGQGGAGSIVQQPIVAITFNEEGADLFEDITTQHQGEVLAIFLDGELKNRPVIQVPIHDGRAVIEGLDGAEEARDLARNLSFGALPVPIELVGAESIGATLGGQIATAGVKAGIWGLILVAVFMIFWYRLPGLVATVSLAIYIVIMLTLIKLFPPMVFTAAGIAGFILSVGMAVDANILIFERMKEELKRGEDLKEAITEGFSRAWLSIRDGNLTTIFGAIILFYTTTSLVKGFALMLLLGVVISMLTAITITRTLLLSFVTENSGEGMKKLFGSGLSR